MAARPLFAAGPMTVAELIRGEVLPAVVLGAFPTAMYLRLAGGEVIAVLTRDAVRVPLGLQLSTSSTDQPLDRWTGPVRVGASRVLTADREIRMSRLVSVSVPPNIEPDGRAVADARLMIPDLGQVEPHPELLDALADDQGVVNAVVERLLGLGPGLTPSGDDLLAGFLAGAWSFGLAADRLRAAVLEAAPARTTELSAALLRCAGRGESIPQVSTLLRALSGADDVPLDDALVELGHVGHTSGAALAAGVVGAAEVALRVRRPSPTTASPAAADGRSPRAGSRR